jgi:hypothetical protein
VHVKAKLSRHIALRHGLPATGILIDLFWGHELDAAGAFLVLTTRGVWVSIIRGPHPQHWYSKLWIWRQA